MEQPFSLQGGDGRVNQAKYNVGLRIRLLGKDSVKELPAAGRQDRYVVSGGLCFLCNPHGAFITLRRVRYERVRSCRRGCQNCHCPCQPVLLCHLEFLLV